MTRLHLSDLEAAMAFQLDAAGLPRYVREYRFCQRRWRADFAFIPQRILVEVEGFGHHKLNRYHGDIEKYNHAAILGWAVIRVTGAMVKDGRALAVVEQALEAK